MLPAVDTLALADNIGCPLQLKERHHKFGSQVLRLTLSKAPVFRGILKRSNDFNRDTWSEKRRRLCVATMFVRLFEFTKGRVRVAAKEFSSRIVNSFTAVSKSFMISSFCLSVTWFPIVFLTLSSLTSFPRSFGAGNPPGHENITKPFYLTFHKKKSGPIFDLWFWKTYSRILGYKWRSVFILMLEEERNNVKSPFKSFTKIWSADPVKVLSNTAH